MLHGNQAVIAWPEGWFRTNGHEIAPHILALKSTFEEIQSKVSEPIVNPKTVLLIPTPSESIIPIPAFKLVGRWM